MSNKFSNTKLAALFGILLVIAIIFVLTDGKDERSFRTELVEIDTSAVTEILIYPRSADHKEVRLFEENDSWKVTLESGKTVISLEAGPYVGTIPLNNQDMLYIIPRTGRDSFSRMMFVVEGIDEAVRTEFDEFVNLGYTEAGNTPWNILLAKPFINKLRFIEKQSLVKNRENTYKKLGVIKGRVKIADTLLGLHKYEENPVRTYFSFS